MKVNPHFKLPFWAVVYGDGANGVPSQRTADVVLGSFEVLDCNLQKTKKLKRFGELSRGGKTAQRRSFTVPNKNTRNQEVQVESEFRLSVTSCMLYIHVPEMAQAPFDEARRPRTTLGGIKTKS